MELKSVNGGGAGANGRARLRVWIDISNSPHALLFAPISRRLEEAGHEVLVTARDHAQSVELARERWPDLVVVGDSSPRARLDKLSRILARAGGLRTWARASRPDVALSHGSYAQILAARSLRLPAVTAMDYEHQPANHLAFRLASRILIPECLPLELLRGQGARPSKIVRYPGIKEDAYIGDFDFDLGVLERLGIERDGGVIVLARTPPSRAVYHHFDNPVFLDALRTVCAQDGVTCVVLPRYPEQTTALRELGLRNLVIPEHAVDSRSLMYQSDVVLGAGGTMTREAALMGVKTYSLFAGRPAAVDASLMRRGVLERLEDPRQLEGLQRNGSSVRTLEELRRSADAVQGVFISTTCEAAA
jgi:predicted glycosyltransferase